MSTTEIPVIMPEVDGKTETWWHVTVNNISLKVVQKKNKFGEPLEKVWVYTQGDGFAYYATTSLATFSQKYWFEQSLGVHGLGSDASERVDGAKVMGKVPVAEMHDGTLQATRLSA